MSQEQNIEKQRYERLKQASPFKQQAYFALENIVAGKALARFIGAALFCLIVANAVLVFVLVQFQFSMIFAISVFYAISTGCFCIEYFFRIWIADILFPQYSPNISRVRYMVSAFGIIDLLAFLPNMISWFIPLSGALMTIINVLRLFRLVKLTRYMRGIRTISRVVRKSRSEIIAAFMVIFMLIVVASVLMYEVESPVNPEFDSLFTGVYWAVTAISSTGYGDVVPITTLGRVLGVITMLLSLACVAIPSGIISAGFVAEYQNVQKRRLRYEAISEEDSPDEYFDDKEVEEAEMKE